MPPSGFGLKPARDTVPGFGATPELLIPKVEFLGLFDMETALSIHKVLDHFGKASSVASLANATATASDALFAVERC
jgi:hypothetical protein